MRVRFHGRGGQGAKVASRIFGTAAFLEGFYVQDFPLYGAERRGAPITSFARVSEGPVLERGVISDPDLVIVLDETLLLDPRAAPLTGLRQGGAVFINTRLSAEEAREKYGIESKAAEKVVTLDLTELGFKFLEKVVLSALAAAVAVRLAGLGETSLREAVEKELSKIVQDPMLLDRNVEAALYAYNALSPLRIKTLENARKGSPVIEVPFEKAEISSPAITATGNTPLRKTGSWRTYKPVWDYGACTKCMTCVVRCPDGCILVNEEGYPYADYENCKGCLLCVEECPAKAIKAIREA